MSPRRSEPLVPEVEELRSVGLEAGLDAVAVAGAEPFEAVRADLLARREEGLHGGMAFTYRNPERSTTPARSLPGAQALVVAARGYLASGDVQRGPEQEPAGRVARYAWVDHYGELRAGLRAIATRLIEGGWRARVLADDNALVDRAAAHRAGLGWWGKNANLLLPGQGSWFVLGAVLTDAPLPATAEPVQDRCGSCTRCVAACPTGAIVAPGVVDARRCLSWLLQATGPFPRQHRRALGDRIYGCDDCQEVCPPNRRVDRASPAPPASAGDQATVDLLDLLAATDDELLDRHGRWYVPRRQARYLRRNALVVLGNVADPTDGRVAEALRRALRHDDGLVRAHAVWAARRLGRDDLLVGHDLDDDADPLVRAEVAAPVERR